MEIPMSETSLQNIQTEPKPAEVLSATVPKVETSTIQAAEAPRVTKHILLITLFLLALIIIFSLIYLNGKSIYEYGI
jgi:hypothetical protein